MFVCASYLEKKISNFLIRRSKLEDRFIGNAFIFNESERRKLKSYDSNYKYTNITKPYYDKVKIKIDNKNAIYWH